jgi:hypothetical protein
VIPIEKRFCSCIYLCRGVCRQDGIYCGPFGHCALHCLVLISRRSYEKRGFSSMKSVHCRPFMKNCFIILIISLTPCRERSCSEFNSFRRARHQGCQMVYFKTKNPNLGKFWRVLEWERLVYTMAIWYILWAFGN